MTEDDYETIFHLLSLAFRAIFVIGFVVFLGLGLHNAQMSSLEAATASQPGPAGLTRGNPMSPAQTVSAPNWDVRVLEIRRGQVAEELIKASHPEQLSAPEGLEYLLVRLQVKNTYTDGQVHPINDCHFGATGDRLIRYTCQSSVAPTPRLEAILSNGGEAEGWAAFLIQEGEGGLTLIVDEIQNWEPDSQRFIALDGENSLKLPGNLEGILPTRAGQERAQPASLQEELVTGEWKLSVLEVIRGADALHIVKEAHPENRLPGEGWEYLVVRVRVQYLGTEDKIASIGASSFQITGESQQIYPPPLVVDPYPSLDAELYPGGEMEGWVVLQAASNERNLLLVFEPLLSFSGEERRFIALE